MPLRQECLKRGMGGYGELVARRKLLKTQGGWSFFFHLRDLHFAGLESIAKTQPQLVKTRKRLDIFDALRVKDVYASKRKQGESEH